MMTLHYKNTETELCVGNPSPLFLCALTVLEACAHPLIVCFDVSIA
jgi:hypothetical protein